MLAFAPAIEMHMAAEPVSPLTDAEIAHLETLLATPAFAKQSMGLDEIQGFVCAAVSGPAHIGVEQWLPAVLGNPEYASAAEAVELKGLLLRFHDEIVADLKAGESLGLVLNLSEAAQPGEDQDYDYAAWCQAYLDGVESSSVPWAEAGEEEEVNDLLFPLSLLAGEIDAKALKQIKPREMAQLLAECREDLPLLVVDIYKYFQSLRDRPKVSTKHPGSQSPPPASGNKKLH
jgi:uncharacterized protein